jgi:hypothetical protein
LKAIRGLRAYGGTEAKGGDPRGIEIKVAVTQALVELTKREEVASRRAAVEDLITVHIPALERSVSLDPDIPESVVHGHRFTDVAGDPGYSSLFGAVCRAYRALHAATGHELLSLCAFRQEKWAEWLMSAEGQVWPAKGPQGAYQSGSAGASYAEKVSKQVVLVDRSPTFLVRTRKANHEIDQMFGIRGGADNGPYSQALVETTARKPDAAVAVVAFQADVVVVPPAPPTGDHLERCRQVAMTDPADLGQVREEHIADQGATVLLTGRAIASWDAVIKAIEFGQGGIITYIGDCGAISAERAEPSWSELILRALKPSERNLLNEGRLTEKQASRTKDDPQMRAYMLLQYERCARLVTPVIVDACKRFGVTVDVVAIEPLGNGALPQGTPIRGQQLELIASNPQIPPGLRSWAAIAAQTGGSLIIK